MDIQDVTQDKEHAHVCVCACTWRPPARSHMSFGCCPGTERWLSARSVRGLGNAPGEAVELRLKQGRINRPRPRAGE